MTEKLVAKILGKNPYARKQSLIVKLRKSAHVCSCFRFCVVITVEKKKKKLLPNLPNWGDSLPVNPPPPVGLHRHQETEAASQHNIVE